MLQQTKKMITNELAWFCFVLPILVIYLVFFILPASSSLYYSLTDWDGLSASYIGFENYIEMMKDKMILTSFRNTAMYSIFITMFQNIFALLLAVFMVRSMKGVNILRTLFFAPAIFSALLVGYVWGFILEPNIGVLNHLLDTLHLEALKMSWLSDPFWARWMIILVTVWQFLGYSMVIYIAGLKAISNELYESADIDGANGINQFRHITFPLIAPSVTINIILSSIGTLRIFDQVYALTGGGPGYSTESVASMIYNLGFGSVRWGYGAAMSTVLFVFIFLLTVVQVIYLRNREVDL